MIALVRRFVPWVLVLAYAAPVAGLDCDFPENLVPNCGFDVDQSGWTLVADSITGETSDCTTGPRCVSLDRHDAIGAIEVMSACIDVNPSTYFTFGGWLRRVSGVITQGCSLSLYEYGDKVCGPGLTPAFYFRPPSGTWSELRAGHEVGGATLSVKFRLACGDENNDFVVRIDDFFVHPAIFVDGFESGDPGFWSDTSP